MTNIEKYNNVFIETFGVKESELEGLHYKSVSSWDSVGQMALLAGLEDAFDIMIEPDDIIDISSYENGKAILHKYNVEL